MFPFEKIRPAIYLILGNREAARKFLQSTYRVSDEQAEDLVIALQNDLPRLKLEPGKIARYVGGALTVLGLIITGVGAVGYFSFSTPEMEWAHVPCTIKAMSTQPDGTPSVTFVYEYQGKAYSITDVSELWKSFGLREGQRLDMLVNPENPEDTRLPIAKPILQKSTRNLAIVGVVLLVFSIVLWAFTRST